MHALFPQIIFYAFASLAVLSAFMIILQTNPVHSVLWLVLTFFCASVLWLLAEAEFLALILVLVYVGAVMTLFLFVVMMLNVEQEKRMRTLKPFLLLGILLFVFLTFALWTNDLGALFHGKLLPANLKTSAVLVETGVNNVVPSLSNTERIGIVLYTDYVYAVELAAVLLLVAIVAAITLAHRKPLASKRQDIVKQIMTDAKDRLTLVNLSSE